MSQIPHWTNKIIHRSQLFHTTYLTLSYISCWTPLNTLWFRPKRVISPHPHAWSSAGLLSRRSRFEPHQWHSPCCCLLMGTLGWWRWLMVASNHVTGVCSTTPASVARLFAIMVQGQMSHRQKLLKFLWHLGAGCSPQEKNFVIGSFGPGSKKSPLSSIFYARSRFLNG